MRKGLATNVGSGTQSNKKRDLDQARGHAARRINIKVLGL